MEENGGGEIAPKCCWCFSSSYIRFLALIFICLNGLLFSATYTMPASMESDIEKTLDLEIYQFEYLFSVIAFPNIILSFVGGLIIDRIFGVKLGAILFSCIAGLGQVIVTIGAFVKIFWIMLVGRFLFGAGTECTALAMNCYSVVWFENEELSFVFGFSQSVGKLGSALAFLIAVPLQKMSVSYGDESLALGLSITPYLVFVLLLIVGTVVLGKISTVYNKPVFKKSRSEKTISLTQILNFPMIFWVFTLMVSFFFVGIAAFVSCSQQILVKKYYMDSGEANVLSSLFNVFAAIFAPIIGLIADKIGFCLFFNVGGTIAGIASLVLLVTTSWSPYIPIILYALHYSVLSSCTWNLVGLMVENYQLATAYGTILIIKNLLAAVTNIFVGYLLGSFGSEAAAILFLTYASVGLLLTFLLLIIDNKRGGFLNMSATKKVIYTKNN